MALREELALDVSAADRAISRLERQLTDAAAGFGTSLQRSLDEVQGVGVKIEADTTSLQGIGREVSAAIEGADTTIQIEADATAATSSVREFAEETDRAALEVSKLEIAVTALGAAAVIAFGLSLLQVGVQYNELVQRALAAFTTLTGSLENGRAVLEEITEFARSSPFPRQAFIEATQILLAFGFAADDVVPTLSAIQDAVAAIGGTTQDIEEIVTVLADIQSTGRITAVELRRLGIRGINAAQILADEFETTEAAIRDSITAGTLDAGEAIDALVAGMSSKFEGAAEGLRSTWFGALDRIRGALRDIGSLLVSPFIDPSGGGAAIDLANLLADSLRQLQASLGPLVTAMRDELGPAMADLGESLIPLMVEALASLIPLMATGAQLTGAFLPVLTAFADVIAMLPSELLGVAGAFIAVNSALTLVNRSLTALGVVGGLSAFGRGAAAAAASSGAAATGIARFTGGIRGLVAGINPATAAVAAGAAAFALYSNMMNNATAEGEKFAASVRENMSAPVETIDELTDRIDGLNRGLALMDEVGGLRGLTIDRDYNASIRAARQELEALRDEQVAQRSSLLALSETLGLTGEEAIALAAAWAELSDRPILEAGAPAVAALRAEQDKLLDQYSEMMAMLDLLDSKGIGGIGRMVLVNQLEVTGEKIAAISREISGLELNAVDAATALAAVSLTDTQLASFDALAQRFVGVDEAVRGLADEVPAVARQLLGLRSGTTDIDKAMFDLAFTIRDAGLSAEQMEIAAAGLGVTVAQLEGFVEQATGALDDFIKSATGALPSTGTVFGVARSEAQRLTQATSGSGSAVRNATRQVDQYLSRLQDAQDELLKALQPPSERDLFRASTARERALLRQEEAVKAVAEAERLLGRVERDSATERKSVAQLREERELALRDARLRLIESTFSAEDAEEALADVRARGSEDDEKVIKAREQLASATDALSDAQERAAEATQKAGAASRQGARDAQVSASELTDAFREQAAVINRFRDDLDALSAAGFTELAATLAEQGPEVAGLVARELRKALTGGNKELIKGLEDARRSFEDAGAETMDYYRTVLGPEMILESGLIGALSAEAFGSGYDLATQIEIASRLAASGLTTEGQALALVASSAGEDAARAYAALFDIDDRTTDAAIEAGRRLQEGLPGDPFGTAGRDSGSAFAGGIATGILDATRSAVDAAADLADELLDKTRQKLRIQSPSKVAADEIGRPFVEGILAGINAGARDIDATVTGLSGRMVAGARGGTIQQIDQSRHLNMPLSFVGSSGSAPTDAVRAANRLRARANQL